MNIQDDSGEGSRANGRWTKQQHQKFLLGLELFGKNWKKISDFVGTRTGSQIRSHAQKFFMKMGHKKKQQQSVENQAEEDISGVSFRSKQNLNNELSVEKIEALGNPFFWNKMYQINKQNQGFCLWDYIDQERKNQKLKEKLEKKSNSFKYCQEMHSPLRQIYIIENNNQK